MSDQSQPLAQNNGAASATPKSARQSLGPSARAAATLSPLSPRPPTSAARPTSELLGSASFQTPEGARPSELAIYRLSYSHVPLVEALDQWLENFQNYEATLVSALR